MTKQLPAALEFHYKQFAEAIEKLEEEIEFWHIQQDAAQDIGRLQRCQEEIDDREKDLQKIYEVAGMLGMSKDILESVQMKTTFYYHDREALA